MTADRDMMISWVRVCTDDALGYLQNSRRINGSHVKKSEARRNLGSKLESVNNNSVPFEIESESDSNPR